MADVDRTHPSFVHRLRDSADPASWHEFHEKYGHTLYRYARSLGAAHTDAEDVVQDVEMQFFQAIGGFDYDAQRGQLRSYLRSAVLHALTRRISRRARQPSELDPQRLDSLISGDGSQQDELWEREWQLHRLRRAVQEVANEFDPPTLKAFEMHVLAGRAAEEAAAELEVSKWSVYRASNRVLARVRGKLAELAENDDP
jgi:RNA polymerase sigma factor (sigma-70 family)